MGFVPLRGSARRQVPVAPRIGRIRMGERVPAGSGDRMKPVVSDGWSVTTSDARVADAVAAHFGSVVEGWSGEGRATDTLKVRTGTKVLPVFVPPHVDPDRIAHYERYTNAHGQERVCTVNTEGTRVCFVATSGVDGRVQVESACACEQIVAAGGEMLCTAKLRLDLFLNIPGVPVVGTFGFESGSVEACETIPGIVATLGEQSRAARFIPAELVMEERRGPQKRYTVPVLRAVMDLQALVTGRRDALPEAVEELMPVRGGPPIDVDALLVRAKALPPEEQDRLRAWMRERGFVLRPGRITEGDAAMVSECLNEAESKSDNSSAEPDDVVDAEIVDEL